MSTAANNGGPAFPSLEEHGLNFGCYGLTKREYFAAKALAGMAGQFHEHWTTLGAAQAAYELADAMLAADTTQGNRIAQLTASLKRADQLSEQLESIVIAAAEALEQHILPDSTKSKAETIDTLLGILDNSRAIASLRALGANL